MTRNTACSVTESVRETACSSYRRPHAMIAGRALQREMLAWPDCRNLICVMRWGNVKEVGVCSGLGAGDFMMGGGTVEKS